MASHGTDGTVNRIPRPPFQQPRLIIYVLVGGMLGTAGREAMVLALPRYGGIPWAILVVNVVGAFLLGFLLTALGSRTPETPTRRDLRLFGGTGVLGGFTTYSSLAIDTAGLITDPGLAIGYALGSIALGLAAAAAGVAVGAASFPASAQGRTS